MLTSYRKRRRSRMTQVSEQAAKVLGPLGSTATIWGLELGLRLGIFDHLAQADEPQPAEAVASALGLDPLYTKVILRSAFAGELLDLHDGRYSLAEHMGTLLLDSDHPDYLGGAVRVLVAQRETFLDLRTFARTGEREWWGDFDPEYVEAIGEHCQTHYRRILNAVLPQLPAVQDKLGAGARLLDLACGTCKGTAKIVSAYPGTKVTAVDYDPYVLEIAEREMKERGIRDSFTFMQSPLEEISFNGDHDVALINVSLHEARDKEAVVAGAYDALAGGGVFLVSEFPFPEREEDTRTVPGRIMCGVQFFESHIGCQLLPTSRFVELLEGAGFNAVGVIDVTPTHSVIYATK
jgi:SAM-dependent methyltransferase